MITEEIFCKALVHIYLIPIFCAASTNITCQISLWVPGLSAPFMSIHSLIHSLAEAACSMQWNWRLIIFFLLSPMFVCHPLCREITASQGTHKRASCSIPCNLHLLNVMRPWLCLLSQIFMKEKMGRGIQGKIQIISFLFPSCFALQGVMIRFQQLLVASLG